MAVAQALEDTVPEGDERGEGSLVEAEVALDQPGGQPGDGQELMELAQQLGCRKAGAQERRLGCRQGGSTGWGAALRAGAEVEVAHWPCSGWQVDEAFPRFLPLPPEVSRLRDLGDSIMTAIVLAPLEAGPIRFTDLGRLRVQECERVGALRAELVKCGAAVREEGDELLVSPSPLHGAEIETYDDHRMAMCFAILGLKVPGIRIKNPSCVKKTFPDFFQKLAAAPPSGLGAVIRDAVTGEPLGPERLLAD